MEKPSPFAMTPREEMMLKMLADQSKLLIGAAKILRCNAQFHEEMAAQLRKAENKCLRAAHDPDA